MSSRMLINATAPHELRIAIVEDGELVELDIETDERSTIRGNIYKGVVHNVEGSLAAAFVDIGGHKHAFLPFSEIGPEQYSRSWKESEPPRITDVIRRGQDILVQAAKDAVGDKGATLTTYLSIPGRYTVLMPFSDTGGISRKIEDEATRESIRAIADELDKPEGCGFIIRTAGYDQDKATIQRDLDTVVATWKKVKEAAELARAPSTLHVEPDLIARTLRDYFNEDIDEVWIDSREEYEIAVKYFDEVMPSFTERLKYFNNPIPIFAYYHIEEQIEATFERRVDLPSGGSIIVDQTEALVAIDVNSGKMTSEKGHEETVFKTNCEAAVEAARQLKLRDLGGIVVIDFIDMERTENKRQVEQTLADAARLDKARYKISRINSKGLLVLTRQRIRQGMRKAFQHRCEVCSGTGWRRTAESHGLSLLRRVETRLAQGGVGEVRVTTHRETAEYVLNQKKSDILDLERKYVCRVLLHARPEMDRASDEVVYLSHGEVLAEITDKLPPREERRRDISAKRRSKRKSSEVRLPVEVGHGASENAAVATAGNGKSSARRRRRGPRDGDTSNAAARVQAGGDSGAVSDGQTTFTGRPPPEMLDRLKAERRARLNQKSKPSRSSEPFARAEVSSRAAMPKAVVTQPVELEKPTKKPSLLERIFGAR